MGSDHLMIVSGYKPRDKHYAIDLNWGEPMSTAETVAADEPTMIPIPVSNLKGVNPDNVAEMGGLFLTLMGLLIRHPEVAIALYRLAMALMDTFKQSPLASSLPPDHHAAPAGAAKP